MFSPVSVIMFMGREGRRVRPAQVLSGGRSRIQPVQVLYEQVLFRGREYGTLSPLPGLVCGRGAGGEYPHNQVTLPPSPPSLGLIQHDKDGGVVGMAS